MFRPRQTNFLQAHLYAGYEIDWWFEGDDSKFEENHVLFKDDEKYMEKLFGRIIDE